MRTLHVIGAGLAGCEAAWAAARAGVKVVLHEMKPRKRIPAHVTDGYAELCCSNSLRSEALSNAAGLLKAEMAALGSIVMEAAEATRVPAGSSLAVDRTKFSEYITDKIKNHPNVTVVEEELSTRTRGREHYRHGAADGRRNGGMDRKFCRREAAALL